MEEGQGFGPGMKLTAVAPETVSLLANTVKAKKSIVSRSRGVLMVIVPWK